jgi:hypothetical protein
VQPGFITKVNAVLLIVGLTACGSSPKRAPAVGEAFVGPALLKITSDIVPQSSTVATVKHGERLELLQRRRRYLRVRTPNGAEGWTDERLLLASADMAALKQLSARAAKMPSQGVATTYGDLNIHSQPSRTSPSFLQIKENEKMDVLTHVAAPRTDTPRKPLITPVPKKQKTPVKKPKREAKYPPPPMPKAPPVPANWLDLSKSALDEGDDPEPDAVEKPAEPTDDWSLVRTHTGQSGWARTRRLIMAIPDEVAQYAEGRRIVSYFPLGTTDDGGEKKTTWLWTTIGSSPQAYDFDSFRVFIWSIRRHRYETAYIDRKVTGYSPVLLKDVELSAAKSRADATANYPGFSICVAGKDGQRYRREYALLGNVVRFAGEGPCEATQVPEYVKPPSPLPVAEAPQSAAPESFPQRFKKRLKAITRGWFGG